MTKIVENSKLSFYAAVNPGGEFDFSRLALKRSKVRVDPSEAKYGGFAARKVAWALLDDAQVPPLAEGAQDHWESHCIAWILQNPDNTLWPEALCLTKAELEANRGEIRRASHLGFRARAIQFTVPSERAAR